MVTWSCEAAASGQATVWSSYTQVPSCRSTLKSGDLGDGTAQAAYALYGGYDTEKDPWFTVTYNQVPTDWLFDAPRRKSGKPESLSTPVMLAGYHAGPAFIRIELRSVAWRRERRSIVRVKAKSLWNETHLESVFEHYQESHALEFFIQRQWDRVRQDVMRTTMPK